MNFVDELPHSLSGPEAGEEHPRRVSPRAAPPDGLTEPPVLPPAFPQPVRNGHGRLYQQEQHGAWTPRPITSPPLPQQPVQVPDNRAPQLMPMALACFEGDHRAGCPCVACADTRLRKLPVSAHRPLPHLAILTTHFNVAGYRRPLHNYWRWRYGLGCLAENLVTVELSFDGRFQIPDALQLRGTERNILWQKEALLAIALQRLPPHVEVVVWCDGDVLFENPNWALETCRMIQSGEYGFVQPFRNIYYENGKGEIDFAIPGSVHEYLTLPPGAPFRHHGPGMCGAAARDILDAVGIPLHNVGGAGDRILLDGLMGIHELPQGCLQKCFRCDQASVRDWCTRAQTAIQGRKSGWLPGDIRHLFHGTIQNRQYIERNQVLLKHHYEPGDVIVDAQGLLCWNSQKPELHREIVDYFINRHEDG